MKQRILTDANHQVTPLHHQVYVVLRQQIAEGVYPHDRPLPAEHELSRLFNVSRITVRRALERLEAQGLIHRSRGRGTFTKPNVSPPLIRANLQGIFENLLAMGLKTKVRLLELTYIAAPPDVAAELRIAAGTVVQKAVRVRSHQGIPFSHLTTYVPEDIGRSYVDADLASKPLMTLMERAGVTVTSADQIVSAKLADPIVGPLLQTDAGTALIWVRRLVRDQTDRPVEYLHALYRPDIYEFQMAMSRVKRAEHRIWSPDAAA